MNKGKMIKITLKVLIGYYALCVIENLFCAPFINNGEQLYVGQFLMSNIAMFLVGVYFKKKEGILFNKKKIEFKKEEVYYAFFAVILAVGNVFVQLIEYKIPFVYENLEKMPVGITPEVVLAIQNSVIMFVIPCIIAPICEEVLFRGVLLNLYVRYSNVKWAIVLSAAVFALMHGVAFPFVFLTFLIVGYLYYKTGNIGYSILVHMGNNLLAYILQRNQVIGIGKDMDIYIVIGIILFLAAVFGILKEPILQKIKKSSKM